MFVVKYKNLKQGLKLLPVCLMLVLMVLSCEKEKEIAIDIDPVVAAQSEIQAAKAWFEQYYATDGQIIDSIPMYTLMKGHGHGHGNGRRHKARPAWERARLGVDNVVEVPLESLVRISYASSDQATDDQLSSAITQMIIVPWEGEYAAAFMNIVADSTYLTTRGYDLSSNVYKDMTDDFTGKVFYTLLDGTYVNGWWYEDGQITAVINYDGDLPTPEIDNEAIPQKNNSGCRIQTEYIYGQICDHVIIEYCENGVKICNTIPVDCGPWQVTATYQIWVCDEVGGGSGSGGGTGGSGSGGSSGGTGSGTSGNDYGNGGGIILPGGGGDNNNPPAIFHIVTVESTTGGIAGGGGTFVKGTECTVSATADAGHIFIGWVGNISSTSSNYSFTVDRNYNVTALFGQSPCTQKDGLQQNVDMTTAVNNLKHDANNQNREVARYMTRGPNGELVPGHNTSNRPWGQDVTFPKPSGHKYDWMWHSHYVGLSPVPSHGDIYAFYLLYHSNSVYDYSGFVYGMVNDLGVAYGITISNPFAFQAFVGIEGLANFESQWYKDLREAIDKAGSDVALAEKALAEALNGSGLSIIKGNNITPNSINWEPISYNASQDTVEINPCN